MSQVFSDVNQLYYFRDDYPVVFLINPDGTIVFKSEGYRIGTGELILKSAGE